MSVYRTIGPLVYQSLQNLRSLFIIHLLTCLVLLCLFGYFQTRFVPGAIEKLENILDWVGLTPDEGKLENILDWVGLTPDEGKTDLHVVSRKCSRRT